jgi:uncharacterized protein YjbI with pentapeptide repeats
MRAWKSDDYPHLSDLDLENAVFEGMPIQGAIFMDSNLAGTNFLGADLYYDPAISL